MGALLPQCDGSNLAVAAATPVRSALPMVSAVHIRDEQPSDADGVRELHRLAFGGPSEARLIDLIRARGRADISLVAAADDAIVGHVLFSPITITAAPARLRGLGLAPLAVRPECQRRGHGSALMREGLKRCLDAGVDAVVVLGDTAYYPRFGFLRATDFGLDNEYGVVDEFMVLELRPGVLAGITGLVKYAAEFREAGC